MLFMFRGTCNFDPMFHRYHFPIKKHENDNVFPFLWFIINFCNTIYNIIPCTHHKVCNNNVSEKGYLFLNINVTWRVGKYEKFNI